MFESLVIVTREGVEAALIVAIVLAYLKKTGRGRYGPWVVAGIAVALVLSVVGAWVLPTVVSNMELVEGWAYLIGGLCVLSLVVWVIYSGKHMKGEIESGLDRLGQTSSKMGWGVAGFVALMIFREGFETALFMTAISFNTSGLERLFGALLGVGISVAFGFLFVRGTLRVDLKRFFGVTTIVLLVLAVQLLVGSYHEFAEAGAVPASRTSMAIVGPVVRYDSILFAMAVLLTLFLMGGKSETLPTETESVNPAERRKIESRIQRDRRLRRATAIAVTAVTAILLTGFISQAKIPDRVVGDQIQLTDGSVRISTTDLFDGRAHYFATVMDNRTVRFFVMERAEGDLAVCLDACLICGDLGYYEEAGGVTCRNCTAPIHPGSLGQSGGCNPIPLPSRLDGSEIVIEESDLRSAARHFQPSG